MKKIKIRVKKPYIGYPGSTIAQNYSESMVHGYFRWDIKSKTDFDVEFKELPNPKPFVTIDWDTSVKNTLLIANQYPKGSRFRIRSHCHISQQDIQTLIYSLKQDLCATEVTFKIDQQVNKETLSAGTQTLVKNDLRNVDVITKLIRNFHPNESEELWKPVEDQVATYFSTLNDNAVRNVKWSLRKMEFDNMFIYGEGNVINFDNLHGIVGIFGQNRTGKSSIIGTLMYSLFNTTDRGPVKNMYICNIRKPYCLTKTHINVNGSDYVIERQTAKHENKKGIVSAPTSLNIYNVKNDMTVDDLGGEQRNDSEKIIRNLIGQPEDFLLTSLSAQGEINQFISHGSSKRRQILSKFLDLDIFDKLYESANKDANTIKAQLRSYPEKNWETLKQGYEQKLEEIENDIAEKTYQLEKKTFQLSKIKEEFNKYEGHSPVTLSQVESMRVRVEKLSSTLVTRKSEIQNLVSEIKKLEEKEATTNELLEDNDIDSYREKYGELLKLESSVQNLKHKHENLSSTVKRYNKSLKLLDEVPCGTMFPTCKFIAAAHQEKALVPETKQLLESANEKLTSTTILLNEMKKEDIRGKIEKLEKLSSLNSKIKLDLSSKRIDLIHLEQKFKENEEKYIESKDRFKELEMALDKAENIEVVTLRSKLEECTKAISSLDSDKLRLASEKGRTQSELASLEKERKARTTLLSSLKTYELISSAFNKTGIPKLIMMSQLPIINEEISKILAGIVDFTIVLEAEEDSNSMEIYIDYGDSKRIIELASGMEKMIASIAIRVALINISSLPKTDMFILDEGFGALDDTSIEACTRLLSSLKKYFKVIFMITHVDNVKDCADVILDITKNENDARIYYA